MSDEKGVSWGHYLWMTSLWATMCATTFILQNKHSKLKSSFYNYASELTQNKNLAQEMGQSILDYTNESENIGNLFRTFGKLQELGYKFEVNSDLVNQGKTFDLDPKNKVVSFVKADDENCTAFLKALPSLRLE